MPLLSRYSSNCVLAVRSITSRVSHTGPNCGNLTAYFPAVNTLVHVGVLDVTVLTSYYDTSRDEKMRSEECDTTTTMMADVFCIVNLHECRGVL
jgi:hypothetical protein